jgi:hypothetical protein
MPWFLLALLAVGGFLLFTARRAFLAGRREAARDMIAIANNMSADLRTPAARETFREEMRWANDLELGNARVAFDQVESELERSEKYFAARMDAVNLAATRSDLEEVRLRIDWLREEWERRRA